MFWSWSQHPEVPRYQRTPCVKHWEGPQGSPVRMFLVSELFCLSDHMHMKSVIYFSADKMRCALMDIHRAWRLLITSVLRFLVISLSVVREDAGFKVPLPSRCWAEVHPWLRNPKSSKSFEHFCIETYGDLGVRQPLRDRMKPPYSWEVTPLAWEK